MFNRLKKWALVPAVALVSGVASAQDQSAVDFNPIIQSATDTINDLTPAILTVGGAIIAVAAVAMGIRWVKATFF